MSKSRTVFYVGLKYFLFFLLFYLLHSAQIEGVRPFAFGMLFALVWCNQKIYILAPLYVLSGLLIEFTLNNIICLFCTVIVFGGFYFLHYKLKKPLNHILIGIYAFLSQFAFIYLSLGNTEQMIKAIITLIVGIICLYAYLFFMQSLLIRGLRRRYTIDEVISAGVFLISVGVGLACMYDYQNIFSTAIFYFLVILFVYIFNTATSISFSVLLAVGGVLGSNNMALFLCLTLASLVANLTKSNKRIFCLLAIFLIDLFVNLYFFNYYSIYMLLSVLLAGMLFLIIPQKTLSKLMVFVISEKEEYALRNIINRSRNTLYKRIFGVSEVFNDMQTLFLSMANKELSPEQAVEKLSNQTQKINCERCARKNECLRLRFDATTKEIEKLCALAMARGKVSVLDVPSTLSSNCTKINSLINSINEGAREFEDYAKVLNGISAGHMLVADQLFGVSQILKSLAEEVNLNITFDISNEQKIIEELAYYHILCSEAVVYFKNKEIASVNLVIANKDVKDEKIVKIVSKILNLKMEIANIQSAEKSGFSLMTLKMWVTYDVVFGSAGVTKNQSSASGDTHSVLRVGDDKIFMALCDGMGSGEKAEQISEVALTLIENFYKAGFSSSLILSSVNKILSMKGEDTFSALDICVFDLRQAFCDLVKLGSPMGFVKRKDTTTVIEAGSLPLGILEDVKPNIQSYALSGGDMIILITDGILEAFGSFEYLQSFINNQDTTNPQMLADLIVEEGLRICQNFAPDDMTVLIGKVWQKI